MLCRIAGNPYLACICAGHFNVAGDLAGALTDNKTEI
jgi:hypothetical protein